ncbi:hypothetical protein [Idiomarina baltica]|uniref:Uncharacterized protein n=1 Tax=Idiomarina baltica OS145 TaxID=314276 RepID=A0ABM9WQH7_9GAMM|nr:hypothetical protein [Idiomarina baltica]EAQ33218.1 hypothetical protein OS145_02580 [Idiomarina baltica OS145]
MGCNLFMKSQSKKSDTKKKKKDRLGRRKRLIAWIIENTIITLFAVTILYGLGLLLFGVMNGVYLSDFEWLYSGLGITKSEESYTVSFYSSAEQDYWFFVFIGIMAWFISYISSKREAKDDKLTNKINHFFPDVDPSSAHMRYLETKVNELSCIASSVHRKVIILNIEDGLIESQVNATTKLVNIHHNHDLTENFGEFYVIRDEAAKKKSPWGNLNLFHLDTPSSGTVELVRSQSFSGKEFNEKYNIKLGREEVGTLTSCYCCWDDITEDTRLTPAFYTREYSFEMVNSTEYDLRIKIECTNHDESSIRLKPGEMIEPDLVYKNIKPDDDEFRISIEVENPEPEQ